MKTDYSKKNLRTLLVALGSLAFLMAGNAQTGHHVSAHDYEFTPSLLTIKAGDTVIWTNTQGHHNVNGLQTTFPANPESFGIGEGMGWTYSYVFNEPGKYDYQCDPHVGLGMVGEIVVIEELTITVDFSGMNPHIGQDFWLAVIDQESGEEVERIKTVTEAAFSVAIPGVESGKSYHVDFYADYNENGSYDAPPTDHAWRIELVNLVKDTVIGFVHNTSFTDIGWKHNLTLAFSNMTPHLTQNLYLALVDKGMGKEVERKKLNITMSNFNVAFEGVMPGSSYDIDFFADHNKNGKYDVPPADHAWRLTVNDLMGDTLVPFVHNTTFTDISWKFMLKVNFTGFSPHVGQLFCFYVRYHSNHEIIDTVLINPLTTADFTVMSDVIVPGIEYHIDFYADMNGSGDYDVPPTDHAWRINLLNLTGDTVLNFSHNTTFTDIDIETVTGTDVFRNNNEAELYPNPAGEFLQLTLIETDEKQVKIRLYNASGKLILEKLQTINEKSIIINLENLKPGIYLLNATGEKINNTYRFIKE